MNISKVAIIVLFFTPFLGTLRSEEKQRNCHAEVEGIAKITSLAGRIENDDVLFLGISLNVVKATGPYEEAHTFSLRLEFPPGHLRYSQSKNFFEQGTNFDLKFLEKSCTGENFDKIVSISVNGNDLTSQFLKPPAPIRTYKSPVRLSAAGLSFF